MASSLTLTALRARIRTQLEAASGFPEPLAASVSGEALSAIRARVEARLQDAGHARWSADDLDEAIRAALEDYAQYQPDHAVTEIALSAAGREIDLSSVPDLLRVERVWWDYDAASPGYPPRWRQFEVWPGAILYIDDPEEPQAGDVVRVWYTRPHAIDGLDGATATTIPVDDVGIVVAGAAAYAALSRAVELAEALNVDRDVPDRLLQWGKDQHKAFRAQARRRPPAWQRLARAYDQDDIDEAIRWALGRYSEVAPHRAIATLTLGAAGREIDISSLSYIDILRVWCPYTAGDPEHPPRWRDFQLWPGDTLYLPAGDEPQAGNVARVWYTAPHTIDGLDGAATTTIPADAESAIAAGAAGYCAQEREQEQEGRSAPTRLREWAAARLAEFDRALAHTARRNAARASGIAPIGPLDRWAGEEW